MMTNFSFSPKNIATEPEKKIAIERLPAWAQNSEQIQKYFDDCVQHWFTPEQQRILDGYIGKQSGSNAAGKVFINEISPARTEYQLAPSMVSADVTNTVQTMLTYPDLVNNLEFNGAIATNESRLLSGRFYSWAPAINPDMLVNYNNYYWDSTNEDNIRNPDYIVMERDAQDGNLWSENNYWFPIQYTDKSGATVTITDDDITSGRFIQAQRPIIEFVKDIELYNFGRNARGAVDLLANNIIPEDIMFLDVTSNIRIDGKFISDGDRILFTSITNPGENNRIYKVVIERHNDRNVYGLILDPAEMSPNRQSGEPQLYDTIRVKNGNQYANSVVYWNGTEWTTGQQKLTRNQAPLFKLYDKTKTALDDAIKYPQSTFAGSRIFSVKINNKQAEDSVYEQNIEKDKYGNFVYQNHIQSDMFDYTSNRVTMKIPGMKFYKIISRYEADDKLYSDWREAPAPSKQFVTQTIIPTTFVAEKDKATGVPTYNREYTLSMSVDSESVYTVDINGIFLDPSEYTIVGNVLSLPKVKLSDNTIIAVKIHNKNQTPDLNLGAYEIPSNLRNNASNLTIETIDESRLADHFYDIIQNQEGFIGSSVGINNFYDTKRDMSVGTKIVQHDASLIPLMVHNSSDRLDIIKAADFAKNSYNNFRNKFATCLSEIDSRGYGSLSAEQVVAQIMKKINIGKSDEFAYWLSGMAVTPTTQQTFIPPTPQYLGIMPVALPQLRIRSVIDNGHPRLYNVSHTGSLSPAFSNIIIDNGVERVVRDFRDDVMFELEMEIYRSINSQFTNSDYIPALSVYDVRPGVFRSTDYSADEWDVISLRGFEQWVITNQIDYRTNDTYNKDMWETWNYTGTKYRVNQQNSRGNWKAIYMDHFDTITPHLTPWAMLGFSLKPIWWDEEYTQTVVLKNGMRSYVDKNMWNDIQAGKIRRGARAGIDNRFARIDFNMINPVQSDGTLIAPYMSVDGRIPLVDRKPTPAEQQAEWSFGDLGNYEFAYNQSNYFSFEQAITLYRAKPAQWTNYFWNPTEYKMYKINDHVQWLHNSNDTRVQFNENTTVHGENSSRVIGYQMWVADNLKQNHIDITRNYGNIVRGANVKLSYRLGGFSKKEQLTFVSDSFGLVSQENQQLTLLKSAVRRQEVLSGVKIVYNKGTFVVVGYNNINPYFTYFKPVRNGKRYTINVGARTLVQYQEYNETPETLRYGTKFKTIQEVYDFLVGYGEYLDSRGWLFEELTDSGEFFDWRSVAYQFANWALGTHSNDDYISLSPVPNTIKFVSEHGAIDSVTQYSGGSWTLVDDQNRGIGVYEISVARIGNIINVRLNDDVDKRIMLIRLNVCEYEHAVVFDNTTIFGDVMYIPELGLHQQRLRVYGNITDGWNGRLEAPGFMIVDNDTIPNFEKLVNDFKHYYDSENPTSSVDLNNLARHVIGYQSRDYLRRLIVNERNQVEFYKGYIKEKGTVQSFDKVLRTSKNLRTPDYKVIEEWAFKVGEYGDVANDQRLEFLLHNSELKQEPQNVIFDSAAVDDDKHDDVITFFGPKGKDDRWLTRSSANQTFPMISRDQNTMDLPTVGPVNMTDVDIIVKDISGLAVARNKYFSKHGKMPEKVWMLDNQGTWDVLAKVDLPKDLLSNSPMNVKDVSPFGNGKVLINFPSPHGLFDNDIFFMYAAENAHPELNVDAYFQWNARFDDTQILTNANADETSYRDEAGGWIMPTADAPYLYAYRSIFATQEQRDAYVAERSAKLVNVRNFKRPVIYNKNTHQTDTYLTLWDPMQGVIPGIADAEIKFKAQHDPAMYNNMDKNAASWGATQVGQVWWNTKNALYLDYTQPIQGDEAATREYRRNNWGKMLPGGTIDLYEWTRSPVHPVEWEDYIVTQSALNKTKGVWIPSGTAIQDQWCELSEYDSNSGDFKIYYYFWVKDAIHVPNITGRQRTISELTRIVQDPQALNLPWFAPISENEFIISGINALITNDDSVLQLVYKSLSETGNVHKQWQLFQEGSDYNFDQDIWQNMVDSLCGQSLPDATGHIDTMLYPVSDIGNKRGNTWFKDIVEARRDFVSAANIYFASTNIAANSLYMSTVFNYVEKNHNPYEQEFNVVSHNGENVIRINHPERFQNNDSVTLSTNGDLPKPLDKSITYFVERITGESDKFIIKSTPNATIGITLLDKGVGTHRIIRTVDINSDLDVSLDMTQFWNITDWYAPGYSASTSFTEVASTQAADQQYFSEGDVIKVTDDSGIWTLFVRGYSRDIAIWATVGRKNSTVVLNDKLFTDHVIVNELNQQTPAEIVINKAIRLLMTVFDTVQSRIVFPMVYYVHNEQQVVDWVFKTSYISILGIDKELSAESVTTSDPLADVTAYINEVKPYRAKIRGSIDQRTSDTELIAAKMFDTDNRPEQHDRYIAEFNKPANEQDFSVIGANFRQQQDIVFFDHTAVAAETGLRDQFEYANMFSSYLVQHDKTTQLPAELKVVNTPNPAYSGIYTEVMTDMIPRFGREFHPYNAPDVMVDMSRDMYMRTTKTGTYYIWSLIGFGWIMSQVSGLGVDWYYEDTKNITTQSANHPTLVSAWLNADGKAASVRGTDNTLIAVSLDIDSRPNPELDNQLERFSRTSSRIEADSLRNIISLLHTDYNIEPNLSLAKVSVFVLPTNTGGIYFDMQAFADICRNEWRLSDAQIMKLITSALTPIQHVVEYLNTANRTKIYDPDATPDYIKSVVNGGFKGSQIHNQPTFRGQYGYSAQSDDSVNGYKLWEIDIYTKLVKEYREKGLSDMEILNKLTKFGYSSVINYVPYGNNNVITKSLSVEAQKYIREFGDPKAPVIVESLNGLNDMPYDASNPLVNDDLPLIDGYTNDSANYDNLGYDKQTRSLVIEDINEGQYLFNINELQVESVNFAKLNVTISEYRPEKLDNVDYGIVLADGTLKPGSTVGSLSVDYGRSDNWTQDPVGSFSWDFGNNYTGTYGTDNGSFSVEGCVVRDPKNPNRVVVSAPRTIKPFINEWQNDSTVYPGADRKLYPFSLPAVDNITSIRIGPHSLKTGDEVLLFANDDDGMLPSGALFNQVDTTYTIKVIDATSVSLYSNGKLVSLRAKDLAGLYNFGVGPVYSMFHLVRPQALNTIRIDTLNYDKFYGRYLDGGMMFNQMRALKANTTQLIVPNHKLTTGDKVKFSGTGNIANIGKLKLDTVYYVIVEDYDIINIVPTIDDVVLRTNKVVMDLGVSSLSMTQVNFWLTSETQSIRRNKEWHRDINRKDFNGHIIDMADEFIKDDLISQPTDEIVYHGFARPNISEGSLRELVRPRLQERVSITVYQDDTKLGAPWPHAFRLTKTPDDQTWNFIRLNDKLTVRTVGDFWYNDNVLFVDKAVPTSGVIEIDASLIHYRNVEKINDTLYKLSGLSRGIDYSYETNMVSDKTLCIVHSREMLLSKILTRGTASGYQYSSTMMFNQTYVPNDGYYIEALYNDNSDNAKEFKAFSGVFSKLNDI